MLVALIWMMCPAPASARILRTRPAGGDRRPLALLLGSGLEFETDGEETAYGFPFLAEYELTRRFKLGVEPSWILVRKKAGGQVSSPGDLETRLTAELIAQRRSRPGFSVESVVKWPTAHRPDLGTGRADYSFGAILSKEFVRFDLDANALYTIVGKPAGLTLNDTFEASVASEWHVGRDTDIEIEFVTAMGAGGRLHSRASSVGGFGNIGGPEQGHSESEFTLGIAEHLNPHLKLEQGGTLKSGGSWQFLLAWEYDFAGGR